MIRAPVILVLVLVLIGLMPAAYTKPSDPAWIAGYWDGNDFDNAVDFIADASAVETPCPVDPGPVFTSATSVEAKDTVDWLAPLRSPASARAPPAAFDRLLLIASS